MKISLIPIIILTAGLLVSNLGYSATSAKKVNANARIEVKCYVELVGGGDFIHYAAMKQKQFATYQQSLVNQKIDITGKEVMRSVYKVHQCIDANKDFKSIRANRMEGRIVK